MLKISFGVATIQRRALSLRSGSQKGHFALSNKDLQVVHVCNSFFTVWRRFAKEERSESFQEISWKANRSAVFFPTPGNLRKKEINF